MMLVLFKLSRQSGVIGLITRAAFLSLHTLTEFVFLQLNDGSLKEEMNARAIVGPVRL
jgi:hypothetical protein